MDRRGRSGRWRGPRFALFSSRSQARAYGSGLRHPEAAGDSPARSRRQAARRWRSWPASRTRAACWRSRPSRRSARQPAPGARRQSPPTPPPRARLAQRAEEVLGALPGERVADDRVTDHREAPVLEEARHRLALGVNVRGGNVVLRLELLEARREELEGPLPRRRPPREHANLPAGRQAARPGANERVPVVDLPEPERADNRVPLLPVRLPRVGNRGLDVVERGDRAPARGKCAPSRRSCRWRTRAPCRRPRARPRAPRPRARSWSPARAPPDGGRARARGRGDTARSAEPTRRDTRRRRDPRGWP